MALSANKFAAIARPDFEFTRETRRLTGLIKLEFGGSSDWVLEFRDGELLSVADDRAVADADCKIVVGGTAEHWDALLEHKPVPFYQCIQSAAVKHGMKISTTNETFAYLPALNRMTTLLRQLKNGKA